MAEKLADLTPESQHKHTIRCYQLNETSGENAVKMQVVYSDPEC